MTKTFTIRGIKMRSASQRRFIVVRVRPEAVHVDDVKRWDYKVGDYVSCGPQTFVAFAETIKRSDSIDTARKIASQHGGSHGAVVVVVDTVTGEEV